MSAKGRPKLGEAAKADTIRIRVTPKERERMEHAAGKCSVPLSSWAREILLAAAPQTK